jgi:hypothetical protein
MPLFLAQAIQFDLTTMLTAAGAGGMALIVWLSRTRIEKAESALQLALTEVNECKIARGRIETQLQHHGDRLKRLERDE